MQTPNREITARHPAARHEAGSRLIFARLAPLYAWATPASYAVMRAVFGIVLITHGLPKLLGTSHGSMADPMAGSIDLIENVLDLPMAPVLAMCVALLEGVGGLLLAAGMATRPIAILVAMQMAGICFALGPTWPWIDRGIEFPFLMTFLALFMAFKGGGRWSIDHLIGKSF